MPPNTVTWRSSTSIAAILRRRARRSRATASSRARSTAATSRSGRTLYVVHGETEKDAKDYFDEYVHRKGDWEAATNLVETMGLNTPRPAEWLKHLKMHFIAGWGGFPLIGTKEQIVDGLAKLSAIGIDGAVMSWPRYLDDMRWFKDNIYPLIVQAGLR